MSTSTPQKPRRRGLAITAEERAPRLSRLASEPVEAIPAAALLTPAEAYSLYYSQIQEVSA